MARQIQISQPDLSFREFLATYQVLKTTRLTQGKQVETFEDDFKSYLGIKHAYALNSGTSALVLSLMALGVKYGDEVIVPNFTFGATLNAVLLVGAKPILVDVEPKTFALDPIKILEAITSRTKVIIVVHLFGLPAEMSELLKIARKNGLRVVEDVAQALGSEIENKKAGTFGDISCFSFYPTKMITTAEGGMIATNNDVFADSIQVLRNQGMGAKYEYLKAGFNFRMSEISAAIGIEQLKRINNFIEKRISIADFYCQKLPDALHPYVPKGFRHVYNQYTIKIDGSLRDTVKQTLALNGISSEIYYPQPLDDFRLYSKTSKNSVARSVSQQVLSLPMHTKLKKFEVARISKVINSVLLHRNSIAG